jgi:hypothetical protein
MERLGYRLGRGSPQTASDMERQNLDCVESQRCTETSTYERSKGVPGWEAPIVCAKLVIDAALERALGSPEFPIGAPPKAHVPPLLTI